MTQTREAAVRLRRYLAERARTPGLDFEIINGLDNGPDRAATLLSSDLTSVLDALGDLGVDPDAGPPYAVDDDVSYLKNHTWHVGKVAAIEAADGPGGQWVVTVRLPDGGGSVVRTVNAKGVGGGVAPLRAN